MSEEQVKFIDKLYKDLYLSDEVKNHSNSKDKNKSIKEYIEFLQTIHNRIIDHNHIDILKKMYYDKYVIKEENIPDSYYKHQEEMYLERGFGHIELPEEEKEELNEIIINDQKKSLDKWLDYFLNSDSNYIPYWAKYWAFQGMLKLGSFNKETGKYTKRTKHTVSKFADLNREALALSINALLKYLEKKDINDQELEEIVKTGSFQSIYTYIANKLLSNSSAVKKNVGKWVKYDRWSDASPLVESLQGYNTGWCTAGEETAEAQLRGGDFYVYYTLDENDEYKIPRIAIRMEGNYIGEIRGVAKDQNLESEMEEVVKEKIKDFPDKDEYYKKVNDMKMLTKIYKKHNNNEDLTKEEIRFLYEMDSKIEGFGYEEDPRIDEIIEERNAKKDLSIALNLKENQIALNEDELTNDTIYCHSSVHLINKSDYSKRMPEIINGALLLRDFSLYHQSLKLPKIVRGNLTILGLESSIGLELPDLVEGSLVIRDLKSAKGLKINKVLGSIDLDDLLNGKDLELPEEINRGLYLNKIEDPTGLVLPKKMNGVLSLGSIKSIKGLKFPRGITELLLYGIKEEKDIILSDDIDGGRIEGNIYLNSLECCGQLVLPKYVNGDVILSHLSVAKIIVLPKYAGMVNLDSLEAFDNIVIPNPLTYTVVIRGKSFYFYDELKEYIDRERNVLCL